MYLRGILLLIRYTMLLYVLRFTYSICLRHFCHATSILVNPFAVISHNTIPYSEVQYNLKEFTSMLDAILLKSDNNIFTLL